MPRLGKRQSPDTLETAQTIALQGLAFLAEEPGRLQRFAGLTGIDLGELRARADAPDLLAAVLEHLASDESLLLVFAASRGIAPEDVAPALHLLQGSSP